MKRATPLSRHSGRHRSGSSRHAAIRRRVRARQPAHIRLALHPLSLFLLLIVGVLITGWTLRAGADSYTVRGKVPAPPLTEAATITSPTDGAVLSSNTTLVTGTCPDASYVTLTRNSAFSGVSACAADHTFSISTALSPGANSLVVQDYNITDDPGPSTPGITVTYNPPDQGGGSSGSGSTGGTGSSSGQTSGSTGSTPLNLISNYHFQAIPSDETFSWQVAIKGGTPPYTMTIDWGDDSQTIDTYSRAQTVTIMHDYVTPGYYTIIVSISDSSGETTTLQLITFIKVPGASGIVFSTGNTTLTPPENPLLAALTASKWLLVAWPAYLIVSLMIASFWLGERQQIHRLATPKLAHATSSVRRR